MDILSNIFLIGFGIGSLGVLLLLATYVWNMSGDYRLADMILHAEAIKGMTLCTLAAGILAYLCKLLS